jgi:hypothetical protein
LIPDHFAGGAAVQVIEPAADGHMPRQQADEQKSHESS